MTPVSSLERLCLASAPWRANVEIGLYCLKSIAPPLPGTAEIHNKVDRRASPTSAADYQPSEVVFQSRLSYGHSRVKKKSAALHNTLETLVTPLYVAFAPSFALASASISRSVPSHHSTYLYAPPVNASWKN